jgi:D-inositol-3-phosphate glycosyltransferase
MVMKQIAIISMHTSPLASLGGFKTGGMNVYVRELARELGSRGLIVDIFTRREDPDQPDVDGSLGPNVSVVNVDIGVLGPVEPSALQDSVQRFSSGVLKHAMLNQRDYEVLYSHYWLSGLVAENLRRIWSDVPIVQMFHTLGAMKNRIASQPAQTDPRVLQEMHVVQIADRVVAATQAEYAQLLWLYRVARRKIAIVPPGVDATRFAPVPVEQARAEIGLPPDKKMLLFVGRLEPLKAVDTIIQALAILRKVEAHSLNDVCLTIVGGEPGNPERERLQVMADKLGVSDLVIFAGPRDHSQLPAFYSAAEALIMPSDYESFGMVALEAMTCGTPVIASGVGGLQYLVCDGETGFLVPVRDPQALAERIHDILTNKKSRDRMGENAAKLALAYDWSNIADQLLDVFTTARAQRLRRLSAGRA